MALETCLQAWLPPVVPRAVDWIPSHVRTAPGSEYDGYFDFDLAPHTRGVMEAWDDPFIREIWLCWATRNMKTSTFIGLMIFAAINAPRPMAFGSCDEPSIDRTIDEQIYPMLEACAETRTQLPPPAKRGRDAIRLQNCRIRKAFGGSKASVAGYPAAYVFLNELDKWPLRKSSEADTVQGFKQRCKGYPYESKICGESSPGEIETSRIWAALTAATTDQRQFRVPCPHCEEFQTLIFEQLKWAKMKSGRSDALLAQESAYYECPLCKHRIESDDRPQMMRAGKWVSEGQAIDTRGRISGEPKVRSPYVGFGPLSSLYSLLISGWGQIAADWLKCGDDSEKRRDFVNSTLALPWNPRPKKAEPDEIFGRLGTDVPAGVCPEWAIFLTRGVDVQDNGATYRWAVSAWGPGGRGALVDYGTCTQEEYEALAPTQQFEHADGGPPLRPVYSFVDSGDGFSTEEVYALCQRMRRHLPCKGSSKSNFPAAFKLSRIGEDEKPGSKRKQVQAGGVLLAIVNTERSQSWIQANVDGLVSPDKAQHYSLPAEASIDPELLAHLANDCKVDGKWQKTGPNDYRDSARYSWAAAQFVTLNGKTWNSLPARKAHEKRAGQKRRSKSFATEGGGREWEK